jgi:hypothetical protein
MGLQSNTKKYIQRGVDAFEPFTRGNVRGVRHVAGYGRLGGPERDALSDADRAGKVRFVIYSYKTPIAWYVDGTGWYVSPTKYSASTSAHQRAVDMAVYYEVPDGTRGVPVGS